MSPEANAAPSAWTDALLAAAMIAVDPAGLGGVHVRSRAGPVRDRWLTELLRLCGPDVPMRRVAPGMAESRLTGGLDIGLTIERGCPVVERGLLASVDGGLLIVAMAERLERSGAAIIAAAIDAKAAIIERDGISATMPARFAVIALDEGVDDEALTSALADRLGLRIDLDAVSWRDAVPSFASERIVGVAARLASVSISDEMTNALCALALSLGAPSLRVSLHLQRAARVAAALRGGSLVEPQDAATSLRLVLGINASPPADEEKTDEEADTPDGEASTEPGPADESESSRSADAAADTIVEAVRAMLPRDLLLGLQAAATKRSARDTSGKAAAALDRGTRGRGIGTAARPPVPGARIDVLATLRQAAPWQRIRAEAQVPGAQSTRLHVRKDDFRYARYKSKTGTTAIFAVDASGSAAVERLAESKGAVELLLAECYVRRDSVALIAFRGRQAETLLEPTRSLVRAKRSLSALPGGGGTPLAGGILSALRMALASERKGQDAIVVFLTDGRGNVALDGTTPRDQVAQDVAAAVLQFRSSRVRAILIDTARRPQGRTSDLARDLGAEYLPLPHGGSQAMAHAVGARMKA